MIGTLRFSGVVAYRFRNELHSAGFSSEAYESLAEIHESEWRDELVSMEPVGISSAKESKHFVAFLSSNGYFEVLADSFKMDEKREGMLP